MKKIQQILLAFGLLAGVYGAEAQSITFCKSTDKEGHALNASQEFTLTKSGTVIVFLFQFAPTKPSSLSYDLYKVEKGKEVFSATMKQSLDPTKEFISKDVTLYDAGAYRVYVYDDKDKLLAKSGFIIKPATN
ncbi:MAG: hypothetical protein ABIO46_13290 [Chitinophagales bacterium]